MGAALNHARISVATKDSLDVRSFSVSSKVSDLFQVEVLAVSRNLDMDFDEIVGQPAAFSLSTAHGTHCFRGLVIEIDQVRVDEEGLATYSLRLAPKVVLLTQRKNYRVFQYMSELAIAQQLFGEWGVAIRIQADAGAHKPRKFRVQYAESDYQFVCRLLEDAGISFFFEDTGDETVLVLDDEPQRREASYTGVRFFDEPGTSDTDFVTKVSVTRNIRPGRQTLFDLDYRRPSNHQPRATSSHGIASEAQLESFEYEPGAFLYQGASGGATPSADDRGTARTDETAGQKKTANRLLGKRRDAEVVAFQSSLLALSPGVTLSIANHPHAMLEGTLLVTRSSIIGEHSGSWRVDVEATGTQQPFRPLRVTERPSVVGLESATVVGPSAEEIHTDEYGRVRVHFHWDRESQRSEASSCWLPTSQPWAGTGFGGVNVPRIGQEVFVEFLGGDPDRPVVVGRVFTEQNPPPVELPAGKRTSGILGKRSPNLVAGAAPMDQFAFRDLTESRYAQDVYRTTPPEGVGPTNSNAFFMGDANGQDITYLRAERDLNILVKNSWTTVVGNYRGAKVGNDDRLHVINKQKIDVVEDRELSVRGDQEIRVGEVREEVVEKAIGLVSKEHMMVRCDGVAEFKAPKSIVFESDQGINLVVKNSSIRITPSMIVIRATKVDVNPNTEPGRLAREAARAAAAEVERAHVQALADFMRERGMMGHPADNRMARNFMESRGVTNFRDQQRIGDQAVRLVRGY